MNQNHALRGGDTTPESGPVSAEVQRAILQAIAGIDYGSVEIVIHDARVVQIEARTKRRFGGEVKPLR